MIQDGGAQGRGAGRGPVPGHPIRGHTSPGCDSAVTAALALRVMSRELLLSHPEGLRAWAVSRTSDQQIFELVLLSKAPGAHSRKTGRSWLMARFFPLKSKPSFRLGCLCFHWVSHSNLDNKKLSKLQMDLRRLKRATFQSTSGIIPHL